MPTSTPPKVSPPKVSPPTVGKGKSNGRGSGRGSWRTVLVVDPDADNRKRIIRLVREAAGESPDKPGKRDAADKPRLAIHEADDGPAAWALVEVVRPDLIVGEVLLEGLSGLQLLRRVKDKYGKGAPVVFFVTEMSNEVDRYWALRNGAGAYIMKPYDDEFLRKRSAKLFEEGDEGGLELDSWPLDP